MVGQMDDEGCGGCTNTGQGTVSCPKEIPFISIANLNREYRRAVRSKLR